MVRTNLTRIEKFAWSIALGIYLGMCALNFILMGRQAIFVVILLTLINTAVVCIWFLFRSKGSKLSLDPPDAITQKRMDELEAIGLKGLARASNALTEGITWENPWDKEERQPVSLFDPAPEAGPIRTWSEQRKEWVMLHPKDCMCQQCYFPMKDFPPDGDLYLERAKYIFKTDNPTCEQRDFAKRLTFMQNYGGTWVESEKPTTRTTEEDESLWDENDDSW